MSHNTAKTLGWLCGGVVVLALVVVAVREAVRRAPPAPSKPAFRPSDLPPLVRSGLVWTLRDVYRSGDKLHVEYRFEWTGPRFDRVHLESPDQIDCEWLDAKGRRLTMLYDHFDDDAVYLSEEFETHKVDVHDGTLDLKIPAGAATLTLRHWAKEPMGPIPVPERSRLLPSFWRR